MSKTKILILFVSLIVNVLAQIKALNPHQLIGTWYAKSIIHCKPKDTPLHETCISFTFEHIERNVYMMKRDLLENSKPMNSQCPVKIMGDKITTVPVDPSQDPIVITILDFTEDGDLVLYAHNIQMYVLLTRKQDVSPYLMEKYKAYAKNEWTMLDIIHRGCQQSNQSWY